MFEDVCLTCGKELDDDRPYCNDQCQSGDLTSPSLSETSSAFSSPHLQYAHGQDVPALVPSALGRALRAYTAHDRYSASSSSASSTAWSVLTDDDDSEFDDLHHDGLHLRPNALSYARRPSGTNNPLPRLHCRTASGSSNSLVCSLPQSAPGDASFRFLQDDDTDCDVSDFASELAVPERDDEHDPVRPQTATITAAPAKSSSRRKRNRASLPTYFSMLQINAATAAALPTPYPHPRTSPVSCSSGHTTIPGARPSPPTPKLSLMAGLASAVSPHHHTPRGRRRDSAASPRRLRSSSASPSRSPSPARRRDSDEKVADWSEGLARERPRGRASVRRNSSPPPTMMLSASPRPIGRSESGAESGSRARTRGRARVEELEGPGSPEHPGLGYGRSGLISRARRGVAIGAGDDWGLR
ncbi:hypothetical protein B0H19DRAFT_1276072 [Mycena capillaripes]|nr:hypothetical protein B0H19DRAFT_1276072 [Mycena capillaripes]